MTRALYSGFEILGHTLVESLAWARLALMIFFQTLGALPRWHARRREIFAAVADIGIGSLPIVVISTTFAGLVVTQEITWHMKTSLQNASLVPGFTGQFILRELGIAIPALLVVSRVGAAMTAQIGSMRVTEQIEGLRMLGIDPVVYLIFPRWIGCVVGLACLTVVAVCVTLGFAMWSATGELNISAEHYLSILSKFVRPIDIFCAFAKSVCFGAVIPIICGTYGLRCQQGAQGVGNATTQAVVTSTVAVIVIDFILTFIFSLIW